MGANSTKPDRNSSISAAGLEDGRRLARFGHVAALRIERPPLRRPGADPAGQRMGVEAAGAQRVGGQLRTRPRAAVEDDRPPPVEPLGLRPQLVDLDAAGAGYVPGAPLVLAAYVDQVHAASSEHLG